MKLTLDLTPKEIALLWNYHNYKLCHDISIFMNKNGIDKFSDYIDESYFEGVKW